MASNQAPIVDRIRIIPRPDDFLDRNVGNSGEVFFDKQSNTLRLYSGNLAGGYSVLTDKNISEHILSSGIGVVEYAVTVGVDPAASEPGNKYFIDGQYKPVLNLVTGFTYVFNQNDQTNEFYPNAQGSTANIHPLNFSSDNLNGELGAGTTYLSNVIYKLENDVVTQAIYKANFAKSTQRSVQITVTSATPTTLYYWCSYHSNMGNTITNADPGAGGGSASISVSDTVPVSPESGAIWYNSTSGILYVYVADGDSNQWVQPTSPFQAITAITDLGISDGTVGQVLTTDGSGAFTFQNAAAGDSNGNFTIGSSIIDTDDSSGITITPPVTTSSDLTVQNDLTVRNTAYANNFVSTSNGTPTIDSATVINLSSQDGTIVSGGPFRLPSFTTTEKNALSAVNGDIIYDSTTSKAQVYEGSWTSISGGGGIALTDLSVGAEGTASGDGAIAYNNGTGVFTYTPPDTSSFLTSVPAQSFASLTGTPTTLSGYGITDGLAAGTIPLLSEVSSTINGATGTVVHNTTTSGVFYHTAPAANFTANFTNVPTTGDRITTVALIIAQGVTQYMPTVVQIDGAAQTIEWFGGSVAGGTANGFDIVSFTLIRQSSTWTVLGASSTYG